MHVCRASEQVPRARLGGKFLLVPCEVGGTLGFSPFLLQMFFVKTGFLTQVTTARAK